ncbi:MAG: NAD(P)H-hydrate dehydratase [Candidatus Hodarchaeota archaeon]
MPTTQALSAEEMSVIERNAQYLGLSRLLLMENAGRAVATEILRRFKKLPSVAIFAGLGGNGGDGFVAARHLAPSCRQVRLIILGNPTTIQNAPAAANWQIIQKMRHSVDLHITKDSSELPTVRATVIVDALLGTGVKGKPSQLFEKAIKMMNQMEGFKVAIDVPTGIHPNTGEPILAEAFQPDLTITFHRPKIGLVKNKERVGKLVVADIGIPPEAELYVGPGDVLYAIQPRSIFTKKGDFGRLLIIGGSPQYIGAPILASIGALRSGVDLVYLAAPRHVITAATSQSPDIIPVSLKHEKLVNEDLLVIEEVLIDTQAVLIGPGLGSHHETLDTIGKILTITNKMKKPLVIDADALKVVSRVMNIGANAIITPHAGEFKRIAGFEAAIPLLQRAQQVRDLAKTLKSLVLLKGPVDIISTPNETRLNWTGHPAMSVGGTGDVLAGLVAGFRAQGVDAFHSACAASFVNGAAGLLAVQDKGPGLVALDLGEYIPRILANPMASPIAYNLRIPIDNEMD